MSRRKFVCGNWKMNMTIGDAEALVAGIAPRVAGFDVDIAVAPPFTALHNVAGKLGGTGITLAAQNCHFESGGAFTGEVAAPMLRDACCSWVILGHSERRTMFGDSDEVVSKKVVAALGAELRVILCLGETLDERDADRTLEVVARQLRAGLDGVAVGDMPRVVIAYEPVWAIGTGRTATPEQAQQVHAFLRAQLTERFDTVTASSTRIQYGGSMKPANAAALLAMPDIDGGLIGGASLKVDDFVAICRAAVEA